MSRVLMLEASLLDVLVSFDHAVVAKDGNGLNKLGVLTDTLYVCVCVCVYMCLCAVGK